MSPERLLGEPYDYSSDIWSVGILIIHVWLRSYPFEKTSSTPIDLLSEIESIDFNEFLSQKDFHISTSLKELLILMLSSEKDKRPKCEEFFDFFWFQEELQIDDLISAKMVCYTCTSIVLG